MVLDTSRMPAAQVKLLPKLATPEIRDAFWKKQANAAVCLLALGEHDAVWPLLKHTPNPSLRSFIIERLARLGADCQILSVRLAQESDPSIQQALILALGDFDADNISNQQRQNTVKQLVNLYRSHPDSGVHSAAAWALRQWQEEQIVKGLDDELRSYTSQGRRSWLVNSQGQTFIAVNGPVEFLMGEDRKKKVTLSHRFAIGTCEVTVAQFQRFRPNHEQIIEFAPHADCPVNNVSWYDAAEYCNWLSKQEGIPKDQWCYGPNISDEYAEGMRIEPKFLERTGYRLTTEAEWEFCCRAGTDTSYFFGQSLNLLARYSWFGTNSRHQVWPVGSLRPNGLGLFDTHGNIEEWCHDLLLPSDGIDAIVRVRDRRVLRGGNFTYTPPGVRSSDRTNFFQRADDHNASVGFRVARTLP
jgi:formylglycine-generating enzyme required for sulfatase activity